MPNVATDERANPVVVSLVHCSFTLGFRYTESDSPRPHTHTHTFLLSSSASASPLNIELPPSGLEPSYLQPNSVPLPYIPTAPFFVTLIPPKVSLVLISSSSLPNSPFYPHQTVKLGAVSRALLRSCVDSINLEACSQTSFSKGLVLYLTFTFLCFDSLGH